MYSEQMMREQGFETMKRRDGADRRRMWQGIRLATDKDRELESPC